MTAMTVPPKPVPAAPTASTQSFRSRLIGTWDLVYYVGTNINDPDDVFYPMGKEAKGQIMYNNDGYMAALLQEGNLKPFANDWKSGDVQELATAAKGTMAYGGPYYLDKESGKPQKIIHHAQISMHPNLTNTLQIRSAELFEEDGKDYIMLGPELPVEWEGAQRLLRLKWQKRSYNDATHPPPDAKEQKL